MSLVNKQQVICSECGKPFDMNVWQSINISFFGKEKKKVMNGDIFRYTCPHCGIKGKVLYNCLYHDPQKKFMIYFIPNSSATEFEAEEKVLKGFKNLSQYKLRLETEYNSFIEKIHVLDDDLNDKLFELLRMIALNQTQETFSGCQHLHYIGQEDGSFKFQIIVNENAEDTIISVDTSSYDTLLPKFVHLKLNEQKSGFQKIDQSWISGCEVLEEIETMF